MNGQSKEVKKKNANSKFFEHLSKDSSGLGIEFVHFDSNNHRQSQRVLPLALFMSEKPISNQEYITVRPTGSDTGCN